MVDQSASDKNTPYFLIFYTLAWGASCIAYVPFLTIILPVRVSYLAGEANGIAWLAKIVFFGAIFASISNILFGYLSDISNNRRKWIFCGATLNIILANYFRLCNDLYSLIIFIIVWQCALNMIIAPLSAMAGDYISKERHGVLGGSIAIGSAMGALSSSFITLPSLSVIGDRFVILTIIVFLLLFPLLFLSKKYQKCDFIELNQLTVKGNDSNLAIWRPAIWMWVARLFVQIAEASLFSYIYFWFRSIDPTMDDHATARIFGAVLLLAAPLAWGTGRWADRAMRPFLPLIGLAAVAAIGLVGMAVAQFMWLAIASYAIFSISVSIFLSLHAAQTLRTLPYSQRRGRDLGFFNLTNTLPSLVMPWLTLGLVPIYGFSALFLVLAMMALFASIIIGAFAKPS